MKKTIAGIILFALSIHVKAQGCSDTGFCSIHSIKNNTKISGDDDKNNEFNAGFTFGKDERSVSYYTWESEKVGKSGRPKERFSVRKCFPSSRLSDFSVFSVFLAGIVR